MSAHWTLGVLIGLPLWLLSIAACFVAAAFSHKKAQGGGFMDDEWLFGKWTGIGLGVVLSLLLIAGFFPYSAQYHRWEPISGEVGQVSSRLLGDGKSTTQKFVVEFSDGRERACDDTRCSLVKPGDTLWLSCKRSWQWAATPGWDCNFVKREATS